MPTKETERHEALRVYEDHGVTFDCTVGDEEYGVSPFNGKSKFYANYKTGAWHDKVLGKGGHVSEFLARIHEQYHADLTEKHLSTLAEDRGLPVDAFVPHDLGWDEVGHAYTLAQRDLTGRIVDIRRYRLSRAKRLMRSTAGAHVALAGAEGLPQALSEPVYVTEGEWDRFALQWLLRRLELPGVVVSVPGASTFKAEWARALAGREVHLLYDHDDAGRQGELVAFKHLRPVVATLTFVHWPADRPDKYDVRDYVREVAIAKKKPKTCWKHLQAMFRPHPRLPVEEPTSPSVVCATPFEQRLLAAATPDAAIAILNERHFVIRAGSSYVVGDERPGEQLRLLPFEEFRKRYLALGFELRGRWVRLGDLYLNSPHRRFYDGDLVSRPPGCPVPVGPHDYNLAAHVLAVVPRPGDWSRLRQHIEENLCRGDRAKTEYFLNWCALLVQQPGRLPGVAICLQGDEGTGKGAMYAYLSALFMKQHVAQITKQNQLVGQFNAILSGRVFVFADEAFFAGDKSVIGALHGLITERRQLIERKHVDPTEEDNSVHLLIASNEAWVLHASQHARRYLVLDVSDAHRQDHAYFDAITAEQDAGGREAFLYDLLQRDLSHFNPFEVPKTTALLDQIDRSRAPHEQWWKEKLTEATEGTWAAVQSKSGLHATYLAWMDRHHKPHPLILELLSKFFVKLYGEEVLRRVRSEAGGLRQRVFVFPGLAECRRRFDPRVPWPGPTVRRRPRVRLMR
jgi:hypothetical protein